MNGSDARGIFSHRAFHVVLGVLGLVALAIAALVDQHPWAHIAAEAIIPVVIILGFLGASRYVVAHQGRLTPADVRLINLWTLLGIGFLGLVEFLFILLPTVVTRVDYVYELVSLGAAGAVAGTLVGYANVKERQRARESAELERAIETSNEGISVADEDGAFTYVNDAFAEMHGYDRDALMGMTWRDLTPEFELETDREHIRSVLEETGTWEGRLDGERKDGTTFPRELSVARSPEGRNVVVARDVTEKVQQLGRLRTLQEAVLELQAADSESEVIASVVSIAQDLIGEPLTAYFRYDHERDELAPSGLSDESWAFVREHGIEENLEHGGPDSIVYERFKQGGVSTIENFEVQATESDVPAPLETILFATVGTHGILMIGSASQFDVTETDAYVARILAQNAENAFERVAYEAELELQNTRLEFLNSILRHDVLNGMMIIRGHAEALANKVPEGQREHAETVVKWSDNITELVTRVRRLLNALTAEEPGRLHRVDIAPGIRDEVDRLRGAYPDTEFEVDVPDELAVRTDDIVHDVIGNVIRNAAEHNTNENPWVEVTGRRVDDHVEVAVSDNGPGVPDDIKERVFQRGTTESPTEAGGGFGLFFVDTMVEHWGGEVRVEDREAGGARFVLRLPASGDEALAS